MRKIYLFLRYYPVVVPLWWYIGLMLFEFSLGGVSGWALRGLCGCHL